MWRGLSLANKTLLLFGGMLNIVVLAALTGPWFRMTALVDEGQLEVSRVLASTWDRLAPPPRPGEPPGAFTDVPVERAGILARKLTLDQARALAPADRFLKDALARLQKDDEYQLSRWVKTSREYRYTAAVHSVRDGKKSLDGVILLERRSVEATRLLVLNTIFLITAGAIVALCAVAGFYILMHKVILQPVRSLKETAERVREGDLSIRSDIATGDEFEELAGTFNSMLADLEASNDRLRGINAALDLKVSEVTQTNQALAEAARLKGDFLANVSHELRTPLHSIIGFSELLLEIARAEAAASDEPSPQLAKRLRYNENILVAARNLLVLINSLLEMAKIDAGKVKVHPERVNVRTLCEGLAALIAPLADKKGISLKLEIADDLPPVTTDPKRLQQIVFNFLSNAVKFTEPLEKTGRVPIVTLRAERLLGGRAGPAEDDRLRISVVDNGPGIPPEEHARIFDKFHQLDAGHTREHSGTGLGLSIAKELATILHGELQLVSEPGRGSMFSVIIPITLEHPDAKPLEPSPA